MLLDIPDLAPILARIESIVYEQERRVDGGGPVDEYPALSDRDGEADPLTVMDDEALFIAFHEAEESACDLIDTTGLDAGARNRARAYVHTSLADFADAVDHENRVVNPHDKARAVCDLARVGADVRILIRYPRAAELVEALHKAEGAAHRHHFAHDADEHMSTLAEAAEAMRVVWRFGPAHAELYRNEFVMLMGDYYSMRYAAHDHPMLRVAAELDDIRAHLARAYVMALDEAAASASV